MAEIAARSAERKSRFADNHVEVTVEDGIVAPPPETQATATNRPITLEMPGRWRRLQLSVEGSGEWWPEGFSLWNPKLAALIENKWSQRSSDEPGWQVFRELSRLRVEYHCLDDRSDNARQGPGRSGLIAYIPDSLPEFVISYYGLEVARGEFTH